MDLCLEVWGWDPETTLRQTVGDVERNVTAHWAAITKNTRWEAP